MNKTNGKGLRKFLETLREDRIKRLGVKSTLASINGMNGSGKDFHQNLLEDTLRKEGIRVNPFRATSLVRSDERVSYHDECVLNKFEEPDRTLELYTRDVGEAWEKYIIPSAKSEGIIILDRDPYSSLVIQSIVRNIKFNSEEAKKIAEKLFPYPIIPPHLSLITICDPQIAYERAKERYEISRGSLEDIFDRYYITAYVMVNGKESSLEDMQMWWLQNTKEKYGELDKVIPNGTIIYTGKRSDRLNPMIYKSVKKAHEENRI